MLVSIDVVTESTEMPLSERLGHSVSTSLSTLRAGELHEMLNKNKVVPAKAPELIRRARAEIITEGLCIPLSPAAYAAYAYLMIYWGNVNAKERADYINRIFR